MSLARCDGPPLLVEQPAADDRASRQRHVGIVHALIGDHVDGVTVRARSAARTRARGQIRSVRDEKPVRALADVVEPVASVAAGQCLAHPYELPRRDRASGNLLRFLFDLAVHQLDFRTFDRFARQRIDHASVNRRCPGVQRWRFRKPGRSRLFECGKQRDGGGQHGRRNGATRVTASPRRSRSRSPSPARGRRRDVTSERPARTAVTRHPSDSPNN